MEGINSASLPTIKVTSASAPPTASAPTNGTPNISPPQGHNTIELDNYAYEATRRAQAIRREEWNFLATATTPRIPSARLMGMRPPTQRCLIDRIVEQGPPACVFALHSTLCDNPRCGHHHGRPPPEQPTINPRLLEPPEFPRAGLFRQGVRPIPYTGRPVTRSRRGSSAARSGPGGVPARPPTRRVNRPPSRLRQVARADEGEGEDDLGSGDDTESEDWSPRGPS